METVLVSIIVPIFNVADYLPDCLDSLIHQTYKELEILLIDNGSTDDSSKICHDYKEKDTRIRLLKEPERGPGKCRNRGLDEMGGNYYCFVDADDYISETFVEKTVLLAQKHNADMVECGCVYMLETRNQFANTDGSIEIISDREKIKNAGKRIRGSIWGKLYSTEMLGDLRFPLIRMGEDAIYTKGVLDKSRKIVRYNHCMYGYRSYQESITRRKIGRRDILMLKKMAEKGNYNLMLKEIKEITEIIEHRGEEKIYAKELKVLKCLVDNCEEADSDIKARIEMILNRSHCCIGGYYYLRLKWMMANILAKCKVQFNYRYRLEK